MHRALGRASRQLTELAASEGRFRDLTELSADWFWETDAQHRITWISAGGSVATLFGNLPTFGKRFWEIPRVEVEPRALEAHLERLGEQLPFFDLEIQRTDEHGDVRHFRAAGAHRSERLVAGRVEEGDLAAVDVDLIGADVLRDAARLGGDDPSVPDRVEQRRLAVVDVTHDRHYGRPRLQRLLRVVELFRLLLPVGGGV